MDSSKPCPYPDCEFEAGHEIQHPHGKRLPPTLTCSEVVERLHNECVKTLNNGELYAGFDTRKAESILHSWRERRVQEDAVKTKRIAYAIAQVQRLRRELEEAKYNLRIEQGYSQ